VAVLEKPLVLEVGQIVAGPTAGLILADLGFNVIKIEQPGRGDIARYFTGPSRGNFAFFNRGKRSMTLNLKIREGREVFIELVKRADVVIDNLGRGTMSRLGLGYETLSKVNEGLVYLSLKGYGSGPYEDRNALDYPIEVETGVAYMNGLKGKPMRLGASIVDMVAAMLGVIGVLHALLRRRETGRGSYIEVGLFEAAMFLMGQHIAAYQARGGEPLLPLNESGFAWAIYDFFETLDHKKIFIAVTTDSQWLKFCEIFKLEVCNSPLYATNESRYEHRNELIPLIAREIAKHDLNWLIKVLREAGISYAVLNTPWDLLSDSHASRKMITINYEGKQLRVPFLPIESELVSISSKDPPQLGEDTEAILRELGYSDEDIIRMRNIGAI
jgi:crotonobetainyl-CoA:carnitine CoA-transferase CaiB-like acyl-CoA transferase